VEAAVIHVDSGQLTGAFCDYVHAHLKSTQHLSLNSWSPDKIWSNSLLNIRQKCHLCTGSYTSLKVMTF